MNAIDVLRALYGGAVARMRDGAFVPLPQTTQPLSWGSRPADGALLDLGSDQRFTRFYNLFNPTPNPNDGMYATHPRASLAPTLNIWGVLDNSSTRLPSGPYAGQPLGADIVGGMGWGPRDFNGLIKQSGEG